MHVQTTGRNQDDAVVLTYERKVQVWKNDPAAPIEAASADTVEPIRAEAFLPPFEPKRGYAKLAPLTNSDTYFEDFNAGDIIEHSRGRTVTNEHIALTAMLDNTSQVHCNQHMIDLDPTRYLGGQLVVFGGIPFALCLGISGPDIGDNTLGDSVYKTGRHTAPLAAGETVFASSEILATCNHPKRPDLGIVESRLYGHKFDLEDGANLPGDALTHRSFP